MEFAARAASLLFQAEVTSRSDVMQKFLHAVFFFPFFPKEMDVFSLLPSPGQDGPALLDAK